MYKLLTLSLLSLTLTLLPLTSKSQEKEPVVLIETNMGNLKANYTTTPPYTGITLSGWQNPATITGHYSIVLLKISWYREALPTVEMP